MTSSHLPPFPVDTDLGAENSAENVFSLKNQVVQRALQFGVIFSVGVVFSINRIRMA